VSVLGNAYGGVAFRLLLAAPSSLHRKPNNLLIAEAANRVIITTQTNAGIS
jgi:hypothetical protein